MKYSSLLDKLILVASAIDTKNEDELKEALESIAEEPNLTAGVKVLNARNHLAFVEANMDEEMSEDDMDETSQMSDDMEEDADEAEVEEEEDNDMVDAKKRCASSAKKKGAVKASKTFSRQPVKKSRFNIGRVIANTNILK